MVEIEILAWFVAIAIGIISVLRKNSNVFLGFGILYNALIFIYFAYVSLVDGVIVTSVIKVLPLGLQILFVVICVTMVKIALLKYELLNDDESVSYLPLLCAIIGGCFIFGTMFLGYEKLQYLLGFHFILLGACFRVVVKYKGQLPLELSTLLVALSYASVFYWVSIWFFGEFALAHFNFVLSFTSGIVFGNIVFLLYVLASRNLVNIKSWNKIAGLGMCVLSLGFVFQIPEIKELTNPVVDKIVDSTSFAGSFGILGIAVAAAVKTRLATLV